MNKTKLLELINQRFEETDLEFLNIKNSPELFAYFTEDDIPTLKTLKYISDIKVTTRTGELNLNKLSIKKQ
ncbi:hypothetical protein ACX348_000547 [Enterococcus hirae]|uniref:hypothetical protein n=1 Tax=Enterococcus hirae TaxID=1354 RepID=UPI0009BE922A|nr:hypothetical protein [Enterococcus hirae]MBA5266495.1 hypothetical protein [Enterococcus hirae]MEB7439203.1 hypothetical protein [Enterococcus hirae]OQO45102.1 hypothetical protein BH733_11580 [Enterococcus hirae]